MFQKSLLVTLCLPLFACSNLPENNSKPSYHLEKTINAFTKVVDESRQHYNVQDNETLMLLLEDGAEALVARIALINAAQESIDIQYYLFHDDLSGQLMAAALWQAAERGVHIRLLVDDMGLEGKDKTLAALSYHSNFEVRIFNPFWRNSLRGLQYISHFGSVTRRMHNKSFTVDSSLSILGGRNIGDVYFSVDPHVHFGDLDIALSGSVVSEVQDSFDLYWNNKVTFPIELLTASSIPKDELYEVTEKVNEFVLKSQQGRYNLSTRIHRLEKLLAGGEVNVFVGDSAVLADDPLKVISERSKLEYNLTPKLKKYIDQVTDEVIIVSPYFVPGKEGLIFFQRLIDQGIKVKILTNSLASNDVVIVHAGYAKYRKQLLEMGVELYEMDSEFFSEGAAKKKVQIGISKSSKSSLHAKFFVLDREVSFVGSLNLAPRSFHENTEIGVIATSPDMGKEIVHFLTENIENFAFKLTLKNGDIYWTKNNNGTPIVYDVDPYTSWFLRTQIWIASWLPGESQL